MPTLILAIPTIVQVIAYYPPYPSSMENGAVQIAEGFAVSVYTSHILTSIKDIYKGAIL